MENEKPPFNSTVSTEASKSMFHSRSICIDQYELIEDYLIFELWGKPKFFNERLILHIMPPIELKIDTRQWAIGKLEIKPVGSKPISKIIYLEKVDAI